MSEENERRLNLVNDLPNDIIVSIFALFDLRRVRISFPLVCRAWRDLYRSRQASPLHELMVIYSNVDDAGRVTAWARRFGPSVRTLRVERAEYRRSRFTAEQFATLVAILGPHVSSIEIGQHNGSLLRHDFWVSLRSAAAPVGRLRSLAVSAFECPLSDDDAESFRGLTDLEELQLTCHPFAGFGFQGFPAALLALTKLRRLRLLGHTGLAALPTAISSLRNLEDLSANVCCLSSLPAELAEIPALTSLDVGGNWFRVRNVPEASVFPAALRGMTSLRHLDLSVCGLLAVPTFVASLTALESLSLNQNSNFRFPDVFGRRLTRLRKISLAEANLEFVPRALAGATSLEEIDLSSNYRLQVEEPLEFLLEGLPRLRVLNLTRDRPFSATSLANLEAFRERLRARNPDAQVLF